MKEIIILIQNFVLEGFLNRISKEKIVDYKYFSQWESPELVDKFLKGSMSVLEDPNWKNSGSIDKNEYLNWSWNSCGMACLKMILFKRFNKEYKIVELGKGCKSKDGYKVNKESYEKGEYLESIDGLFYKGFCEHIKKEFGLNGHINNLLTINEIILAVEKGKEVIVSVSPRIRNKEDTVVKKGGHLVLITGYDLINKTIYIHNPSGFYEKSQENYCLTFNEFNKFFANRGVIIN